MAWLTAVGASPNLLQLNQFAFYSAASPQQKPCLTGFKRGDTLILERL